MEKDSLLMLLLLFTLLAGLAIGFWQLYSVDRAKKRGSTSALGDRTRPN